ncbi:HlyD family efflux transporter periplasmic adaptor subunit [Agreia sp. PsM10]|uniref:efflux RND transporter periplasmic adaptor subunit n=1 Tax=Agreia sp. PsM10 TaxID=3030533 RepID=UPI00263B5797|nr:HlyD family efflux transporter periplasmic adaptor subunit [Agreia sp. PsM10]MDN4639919.1 HlyD family efflux transporter periplasmic adaptor subunit [Agreia sp. PsM10]
MSKPEPDDPLTPLDEHLFSETRPTPLSRRLPRKRLWVVGLSVTVIAVILGVVVLVAHPFAQQPAAKIATATVETGTVTTTVEAKGAITAAATSNASFSNPGTITGISVTIGQPVVVGQDLATIDSADADRALAKAQGALGAAETALDNSRESYSNTATDLANARATRDATPADSPDYSTAVAAVRELENALPLRDTDVVNAVNTRDDASRDVDAAQAERDKMVLKASIAGVVTAINGTVGSVTTGGGSSSGSAGSPGESGSGATAGSATTGPSGLITISDTSSLFVSAAIPEASIGTVAPAQSVTVTMAGDSTVTMSGSVVSIAPTPQTNAAGIVTFAASIQLTTPPATVRIGETALVSIVTASAVDVPTLPMSAVTMTGPGEGTAQLAPRKKSDTDGKIVPIKVGLSGDGVVEITHGLAVDDVVQIATPSEDGMGDGADGSSGSEGF